MKESSHSDFQRVIGKLEEFQDWSKKRFDSIEKQFDSIHKEIEILNKFRWQIYGGAALVSSSFAILFEIVRRMFINPVH